MSNSCETSCGCHSDGCTQCGHCKTVILSVLVLMAFAALGYHFFAKTRKDVNATRAAERTEARLKLEAEQSAAATSYGFIDKQKGVVRLPLDRAMALTVKDQQEQQKKL